MSKYSPLAEHLTHIQSSQVRLTFTEIEEIIGEPLPPSAHVHSAWWSNSSRGQNGWPNLWKRAGWVRSEYDQAGRWVVFRRAEHFEPESEQAREGYEIDRKLLATARNAALAGKRKERDKYTCQACGFHLQVGERYVIEVHHLEPLGTSGEVITTVDKLVCLCPTCHRVAHLRSPPYGVREIQGLRGV